MVDTAALPLRRITRSEPIVTSRHVATRPRIGRVVSASQTLANGLGRPSSVRRSIQSSATHADVKFPQWLLPAAAGKQDDLDPWRRFEQAAPDLAARIDSALAGPIDEVGPDLLRVADGELRERWPAYPAQDTALVLALLTA